MHELHLAKDLLVKIQQSAKAAGQDKVSYVKIQLGQSRFTHLAELKELLTEISQNTIAEGAKVEFEIIPLEIKGHGLISGRELVIKELG